MTVVTRVLQKHTWYCKCGKVLFHSCNKQKGENLKISCYSCREEETSHN